MIQYLVIFSKMLFEFRLLLASISHQGQSELNRQNNYMCSLTIKDEVNLMEKIR